MRGALPPHVKEVTRNQKDYGRDHDGSSCALSDHAGERQNDDQDAGKDCNATSHQRGQPMNFTRLLRALFYHNADV